VAKTIQIFLFLFLVPPLCLHAQQQRIDNFIVRENLTRNGKLAIIAVDSADRPSEHIDGTFGFGLNGFQQELVFHGGVAVVQHPLESSAFVFFKHQNHEKSIGRFYYVHKSDDGLYPIQVQGWLLLIVPVALLLIAYAFKRFIVVFIVIAAVFAYFHYTKGLAVSQLLESIFLSVRDLV